MKIRKGFSGPDKTLKQELKSTARMFHNQDQEETKKSNEILQISPCYWPPSNPESHQDPEISVLRLSYKCGN